MLPNIRMLGMRARHRMWTFCFLLETSRLLMYFAVLHISSCKSITSCTRNEVATITRNGSSFCLQCPDCPPGLEPTVECGSTIMASTSTLIGCQTCRRGMFKDFYGSEACRPCSPCGKHQIVRSECLQTTNTVCGKCRKGFYRDNNVSTVCLPCSNCCMDGYDVEIEECSQAGLPFNRRCSFHRSKACNTKCGPRQIAVVHLETSSTVKGVKNSRCFNCPVCPSGKGLNFPCGGTISTDDYYKHNITCVACVPGRTYSVSHNSESCRPCRWCGLGREVIRECNPSHNRVCGNCKPGYYLDPIIWTCSECSWCCNDSKHDIEEQCSKQGVPPEKRCRRTLQSINECYKLNFKYRHKLNSTHGKNEGDSRESLPFLNIYMLVTLILTVLVLSFTCVALYKTRKNMGKKSTIFTKYFRETEIKDKAAFEAGKPSLQLKTKATDCESSELEWPTCAGPLVPHNAIRFGKSGVEILFPNRESYRKNHNFIAVEIVWNSKAHPSLSPNSFVLSPVIKLQPQSLRFNQPILVTLPHSARIDTTKNDWFMVVKSSKLEQGKISQWKEFKQQSYVERNVEEQDSSLVVEYCQLKLEVNKLMAFVVIGQPRDPEKTVFKRMQCAVFTKEQVLTGNDVLLSLYLIDDCEAPFEKIVQIEKKKGRKITGSYHSFNLRCTSEGQINIDITKIIPGWEIVQGPQEISFSDCLGSYHTIPHREIKFANKDHTKKKFQCTLELSDSYGKALAVMPMSVYCYEDPLDQMACCSYNCPKDIDTTTLNIGIPKEPYPDLPRRALTLQEKLNLKPLDLPVELRDTIVFRLDSSNWKDLASRIGVDKDDIRLLDMSYLDPTESPTTQLLYYIDAKFPEMKVSQFLQILKEIKRQDICKILNNWLHESDSTDV